MSGVGISNNLFPLNSQVFSTPTRCCVCCWILVCIANGTATNRVKLECHCSASVIGIVSAMTIMLGPDVKASSAYGKLLKAKKEGVAPTFNH